MGCELLDVGVPPAPARGWWKPSRSTAYHAIMCDQDSAAKAHPRTAAELRGSPSTTDRTNAVGLSPAPPPPLSRDRLPSTHWLPGSAASVTASASRVARRWLPSCASRSDSEAAMTSSPRPAATHHLRERKRGPGTVGQHWSGAEALQHDRQRGDIIPPAPLRWQHGGR